MPRGTSILSMFFVFFLTTRVGNFSEISFSSTTAAAMLVCYGYAVIADIGMELFANNFAQLVLFLKNDLFPLLLTYLFNCNFSFGFFFTKCRLMVLKTTVGSSKRRLFFIFCIIYYFSIWKKFGSCPASINCRFTKINNMLWTLLFTICQL